MDRRVRLYEPEDFDPVTELWHRARVGAFPDLEARLGYTLDGYRAHFHNVILVKNAVWVVEVDGRPAGFMAIAGDFVDQLFVDPDHQRQGAGSALLDRAKHLSPEGLRLFTFQSNTPARAFYEKHGFTTVKYGVSPAPESEPDVEYHWKPQTKGHG